jgi:hypothetical protein
MLSKLANNAIRYYGRKPFYHIFPNCSECVYYYKNNTEAYGRCKLFKFENHIDDKEKHEYADYARRCESKCGHEGKHYVRGPSVREEK